MATEFVCAIKSSGGDYSDLSTWESAIQNDLSSSSTMVFSGSVGGSGISDSTSVTLYTSGDSSTGVTGTLVHHSSSQAMLTSVSDTGHSWTSGEYWATSSGNSNRFTIDAVTADTVIAVAECDNYEIQTSQLYVFGWTTTATNCIRLRPASGQDRSSSDPLRYGYAPRLKATSAIALWPREEYVETSGLDIYSDGDIACIVNFMAAGATHKIGDCVFKSGATANDAALQFNDADLSVEVWNSVAYGACQSSAPFYIQNCTSADFYNCTAYGGYGAYGCYGFWQNSGTVTAENCYAASYTYSAYYGTISKTTCASSDSTGSSGLQDLAPGDQFTSISAGSENFQLKSDADLLDAGTNGTGGTGLGYYPDDIYDTTRPSSEWDIGAHELESGETIVSPSALSATTTLRTPTVTGEALVSPSAFATTVMLPAASATGAALAEPSALTAAATLPAPTVTGEALVEPAASVATVTLPAPTIITGGAEIVTPSAVMGTAILPAPTVTGEALAEPGTVTGAVILQAPTVSIGTTVAVSALSGVASLQAPTVTGAGLVEPAALAGVVALPTPTITTGAEVPPLPLDVFTDARVLRARTSIAGGRAKHLVEFLARRGTDPRLGVRKIKRQ